MAMHIQPGHPDLLAATHDDRPTRFCFNCRKHTAHHWRMTGGQAYYEPTIQIRCTKCRSDATCFPGCEYDGPRPVPETVGERLGDQVRKRTKEDPACSSG